MDPLAGRSLGGDFVLEAILEAGGMATVYRAKQLSLQRAVAIKVLVPPPRAPRPDGPVSGWQEERFDREAAALSLLQHPNIVTVLAYGREPDGVAWLAMELLEGESLRSLLASEGALAHPRATRIMIQVLRALAAAHARSVVHRDLKPENVFLCRAEGVPDHVRLLDFGLVNLGGAQKDLRRLTAESGVLGTFGYIAPEYALGERGDARTDLFSAGVIFHELLTGVRPEPISLSQPSAQLSLPVAPAGLPEIPKPLAALVGSMSALDPEARPRSAEAVLLALDALAASPQPARVHTVVERLPPTVQVEAPRVPAPRRWPALAAAVAAVAVLALIVALRPDPEIPSPSLEGTAGAAAPEPATFTGTTSLAAEAPLPQAPSPAVELQEVSRPSPAATRRAPKRLEGRRCPGGLVSITSSPPGAQLFIDGKPRGETPAKLALPSREHLVEATWKGARLEVTLPAQACRQQLSFGRRDPTKRRFSDPTEEPAEP